MKKSVRQTPDTGHKISVLAGIAAYNEARYVGSILLQARQYVDEIIVVDDGSTDNTARVAELGGATVIRHAANRGKGTAIQSILAEAKKRNPDVLVLLDADSQHDPNEIPALIKPISEGFDLVIGSREAQKDKTPRYRRIGQKVLLRSTRLASKTNISDSESGFRALSPKAINELELKETGFAIESEMITSAADKKLRISEVPISNIYTMDGSTLNPIRHGIEVLSRVIAMISQRRPLFFFGLAGGLLLLAGLITGIRVLDIAATKGDLAIGSTILTTLLIIAGISSIFTGIILNALSRRK
ncbi:MAG TPA: glycosyltransferase family 2 protein [Dehalococcoidia bacterium]|nr:glycosyltransferase family 2 protein [Dehalococcoidia bacterium]